MESCVELSFHFEKADVQSRPRLHSGCSKNCLVVQIPGNRLHRKLRANSSKQEAHFTEKTQIQCLLVTTHLCSVQAVIQSILAGIFTFKGGQKPPTARPSQLPLLSHSDFRSTTKQWLTSQTTPARRFSDSVSPSSVQCRIRCSCFFGRFVGVPSQDDGHLFLGHGAQIPLSRLLSKTSRCAGDPTSTR